MADGAFVDFAGYSTAQGFVQSSISVTSPVTEQLFQRDRLGAGQGKSDIRITGTYVGSPVSIEASWNGGSFVTIVSSPSGGTFSSKLPLQSVGNGTLVVRFSDDISVSASVSNVKVGSRFVLAGQSNSSGRGTNNQSYTGVANWASLFKNSYLWDVLADPTDDATGQVDSVSDDGTAAGSPWPLLGTSITNNGGVPVAFIPCALGGTGIVSWLPGSDPFDRTTLFGSMAYRAIVGSGAGGVEAVLMLQGETDALNGMSAATYYGHGVTFSAAIRKWMGCPVVWGKLGSSSGGYAAIQSAIDRLVAECPDVLAAANNPSYDNDPHWVSDQSLSDVADAFWNAISPLFYFSVSGAGNSLCIPATNCVVV